MYSSETLANRSDLVEHLLEVANGFDRRGLGYAMKAVFGREHFDASGITAPTLVLVGQHDLATPPVCARRIAQAIHGSSLVVVPGAGHLTAEEQPEIVAELLLPFLNRCFSGS